MPTVAPSAQTISRDSALIRFGCREACSIRNICTKPVRLSSRSKRTRRCCDIVSAQWLDSKIRPKSSSLRTRIAAPALLWASITKMLFGSTRRGRNGLRKSFRTFLSRWCTKTTPPVVSIAVGNLSIKQRNTEQQRRMGAALYELRLFLFLHSLLCSSIMPV